MGCQKLNADASSLLVVGLVVNHTYTSLYL